MFVVSPIHRPPYGHVLPYLPENEYVAFFTSVDAALPPLRGLGGETIHYFSILKLATIVCAVDTVRVRTFAFFYALLFAPVDLVGANITALRVGLRYCETVFVLEDHPGYDMLRYMHMI